MILIIALIKFQEVLYSIDNISIKVLQVLSSAIIIFPGQCHFFSKFLSSYYRSASKYVFYLLVFEEKPHLHGVGDGDGTSPNSELPTPSSISSPTEPTKSTNLEDTGSSNQTQDSTEIGNRSKNAMGVDDIDVPDTRQAPLALEEPDTEVKPLTGKPSDKLVRNV